MSLPGNQKTTSSPTPPLGGWGVCLTDTGKRYNRDWIFRRFNYTFTQKKSYAITGPNGSGKSTLLQAISGSLHLNEGTLEYSYEEQATGKKLPDESIYQYIAIVAPYLELVEEMTAKELLQFHSSFKPLYQGISIEEILALIGLENAMDKQIRFFSSGMKQRLKLAQAVFSDTPVLLLDEPCTNLDAAGYELYHTLIQNYCTNKLIVVSSNDANEMDFCTEKISMTAYK